MEYTSDLVAVDIPSFVDKCLFMQVDQRLNISDIINRDTVFPRLERACSISFK